MKDIFPAMGGKPVTSPWQCEALFVLVKQQKGSRLVPSQRDYLWQASGNVLIWRRQKYFRSQNVLKAACSILTFFTGIYLYTDKLIGAVVYGTR